MVQQRALMVTLVIGLFLCTFASFANSRLQAQVASASENVAPVYAFTFFRDNGQDGVYLALSENGFDWKEIPTGKPILKPNVGGKLTRDPSVTVGGDGLYHMVWTTSWTGDGFGVAHSKDLLNWSEQEYVPINAGDDKARNTWAPEIFFDQATNQYLVFWATTRIGDFPATLENSEDGYNHRMYVTTTKDFAAWEPKKLFYDGGFNVIDAFLFKAEGRYGLIVKDETLKPVPEKNLKVVWSKGGALGPWEKASPPFTDNKRSWAEGPTVLKVGTKWLVYFDEYNTGRYAAVETEDFKSFKDVKISLPPGVRHGTMFSVDPETARKLRALK